MHKSLARSASNALPLHMVTAAGAKAFLAAAKARAGLAAAGFAGRDGELMPQMAGSKIAAWVLGLGEGNDAFAAATFAEKLPDGVYRLGEAPGLQAGNAAPAWLLGTYAFSRYKKPRLKSPRLALPPGADGEEISRMAEAVFLARDLINTPANDLGPDDLAAAAKALATVHGARVSVIRGAALKRDFPLIEAVGRGSSRPPCLIDLTWGKPTAPRVTLVGKGVCFDSGGLDLKPSAAMLTMKKDMGGAATALAIAAMVMGARLHLRLRLLIPAVENSVSGAAFRPGDVFKSRKGLTIEIGNTDAEGRLILADALALADEEAPELLLDIATLTGAARSATGMELPPFFTDDEALAADLSRLSMAVHDPLWRLPLWQPYDFSLGSRVADLNNNPAYGYAGAITAALFLKR
ncbi:MAG: leucyl aminopeptidase family protein, partial [Alphaproteobacteria bacterium]|nr:leucyl aminopeptidase family protein [Alphaproteobacteria bacterium]